MKHLSVFLKLVFIKIVQYMEVCALFYIGGIAAAVGLALKIPDGVWEVLSRLGVIGTVLIVYVPILALHAAHVVRLKRKKPSASYLFFLEDGLTEHRFTTSLAVLAAILTFFFGIVNYNFAIDTSHPQHVSNHVVKPWESNPVSLEGKIIREPEFRDFNVWLYIQPTEIDRDTVSEGLVMVKIARTVEGFEEFEYGQYVRVRGQLREPEPMMNPGTFDYKRYLNNRNIFGLMNVNRRENIEDMGRKESNPLFDISLWVKKKFLGIMKQTLPYPHSAFQGGIIYGLKTGLPHDEHFEFKWAGMAWVLVVAGAHLLMVYLTLKMILESIRPNPKIAFSVLFVLLIIFLILTGINPPTVRAFIMIMLYEFTKVFLGQDIRAAVRSAIGIAAFLLLASHVFPYFSPLMIFDPTVTLSFGAVLSLVYLSRPIDHFLRRYCYGLTSVVILTGFTAALVSMSVLRPPTLSLLGWQQLPIWLVTVVAAILTIRLNNRYRDQYQLDHIYLGYNDPRRFSGPLRWIHPDCFTYNNLPKWVIGFAGAQLAIQFGMVLPLSSWYFQRSPVGGLLANVIAFPTLGVIIQVGLMAVLIGMIPVIGLPLAFILNAADYLGIQLLMSLAHWSKELFPYPMAMKPTGGQIMLYYMILFGFVLFDRIFYSFEKHGYMSLRETLEQKFILTKGPVYGRLQNWLRIGRREAGCLAGAACIFLVTAGFMAQGKPIEQLRILVMEVDDGSGTIVETTGGRRFLVDGGKVDARGMFDVGERTVATVLLGEQIEHLDAVIITSLKQENIGGLPFILENFTVGSVLVPFDPAVLLTEDTFTWDRYDELGGYGRVPKRVIETVDRIRMIVREKGIPVARMRAGDILARGGGLEFDVLNPDTAWLETERNAMGNNGAVLRLRYGGRTFILAGDIDEEGEAAVLRRLGPDAKSAFVLIPSHGHDSASGDSFVAALKADHAVVQYRSAPFRRSRDGRDKVTDVLQRYADEGAKVYRTDLMGAITLDAWADGRVVVKPMLSTAIPDLSATADSESDTDVQDRARLKSEGTGL